MASDGKVAFLVVEIISRVLKDGTLEEKRELKEWLVDERRAREAIDEGSSAAKGGDALREKLKELEAVM